MSMAPSQLGAFTRSSEDKEHANLEYHVQPLSLEAFGEDLHPFDAFTASVCNLNPTSRGQVVIQSSNWRDAPLIQPNYLSTEEDRKIAADSLRQVRKIVAQSALAKYEPEEYNQAFNTRRMTSWPNWRAILRPPFSTRSVRQKWGVTMIPWRFVIANCAYVASQNFEWSMPV